MDSGGRIFSLKRVCGLILVFLLLEAARLMSTSGTGDSSDRAAAARPDDGGGDRDGGSRAAARLAAVGWKPGDETASDALGGTDGVGGLLRELYGFFFYFLQMQVWVL